MVSWMHSTYLVNSATHLPLLGGRPHATRDLSVNVWWVSVLALGEGWHNNHHAFPASARHGWTWWQWDPGWLFIRLLEQHDGSTRLDLGAGRQIVREYERVWLERSPVTLDHEVRWGEWRITSDDKGLKVRGWRPGDRLAGRTKKIQDVCVDAKVPRSEREAWPLVVRGDEVVAVPGIVEAEGVRAVREPD